MTHILTPADLSDLLKEIGTPVEATSYCGATAVATFKTQAEAHAAVDGLKARGVNCTQYGALVGVGRVVTPLEREVQPLMAEMVRARAKFPSNRYLMTALAEEIGEMADAWVTEPNSPHARHEALQVACVAMRIAMEGADPVGESKDIPLALRALEPLARAYFASLNQPHLEARSEVQELHLP